MADLLEWASQAGRGAIIELVCGHAEAMVVAGAEDALVIRLPGCLVASPKALPYELLACGVSRVELRFDACPDRDEPGAEVWAGLFAAYGADRLSVRSTPPATDRHTEPIPVHRLPRFTRRGFLTMLGAPSPEREEPGGTEHQRLRRALAMALDAGLAMDAAAAAHPGAGWVLEAPACEFDAVCVQSCPEGALTVERAGSRSTLVLDPGACTGCSLCQRVCPTEALRSTGPAAWDALTGQERVGVATATTRPCERCQVLFRARGTLTLCPTCAFRRANPFASALPDEVRARRRLDGF